MFYKGIDILGDVIFKEHHGLIFIMVGGEASRDAVGGGFEGVCGEKMKLFFGEVFGEVCKTISREASVGAIEEVGSVVSECVEKRKVLIEDVGVGEFVDREAETDDFVFKGEMRMLGEFFNGDRLDLMPFLF